MMTPSGIDYPLRMPADTLNVAEIVPRAHIHGPGERFVVWLQGCAIRCKGCWNQQMWAFTRRRLVTVDELLRLVLREEGVQGVTILGGEPFHQRTALLSFVRRVKERGLDVVLYTGFELEEMDDAESRELISLADMTICGRYEEKLRSIHLKWRGSSNQRIIMSVVGRWTQMVPEDGENEVEIHIEDDGEITLLGYPDEALMREVRK